ncbi:hypothetical protein BD324DRAFT_216037 [Kockovaella imperatae]|uniref:Uncharacterized protein n=1 Tax=Kockovaella imperatae TaxID=4999 RepID=A0A1Y1U6C4_9TREE|nr:hypothetical protein BD324DRAFT_216037 [Kockovaella imperatae]ORX33579.1 hypothetical protein BD324DRAFT_216037 [Kockovaella imperatae]
MYNAYSVSDVKNPSDVRTFYTNSCIPSVIHQGRPLYDDLILSPEVSYRVESYIGPAMLHTMSTNDGTNTMMRTDDDQFIRPICPTVVDSVKVVNGSNWGTNQWLSALLEGPPPNPPPPGADWRKYNSAPTNTSRKTNTMVRDTSVASSKPGIIKPQGSRPEYGTSTAASSQPGSMPIGPGKVRSTPGTSNSMAPNRGWHNVSKGSSMPPNVEFAPTRFAPNHISTQGGPPPGLGGTSMGSGKSVKYASQPSQPSLASGPSTYQASQTYSASRPPPPPPPPPASTAGFCSSLGNQSAHAYQSAQAPYPPREWIIQPTGSKYEDSPTLPPDGADKYQGTTMSSVPIHATYNPGHESRSAIKSGRMNMYTPETSLSSSPVDVGVLSRPSSAGCDHWHS